MLLRHFAIRVVLLCSLVQGGGRPHISSPPPHSDNLRQNTLNPSARWLVQKFGGTGVGKYPIDIARDIVAYMDADTKVAIVCSARSGSTKALGTTSLLLRAASEIQRRTQRFHATVDLILEEHLTAARASVKDVVILHELEAGIWRDCEWLRSFLRALQIVDEPISPQATDLIVGLGERLACRLMSAVLRDRASRVVEERIEQCGTRGPVLPGFFGPVPGSLLRHIGSGYVPSCAYLALGFVETRMRSDLTLDLTFLQQCYM